MAHKTYIQTARLSITLARVGNKRTVNYTRKAEQYQMELE